MSVDTLHSPAAFLRHFFDITLPSEALLRDFERGAAESPDALLAYGKTAGAIWRAWYEETPFMPLLLGYITAYFQPALAERFAVSMAGENLLDKYGGAPAIPLRDTLRQQDASASTLAYWPGTPDEVNVSAHPDDKGWRLIGQRAGAAAGVDAALVIARPEGHAHAALFAVPDLPTGVTVEGDTVVFNDSEALLLGGLDDWLEVISELENTLRLARTLHSLAISQRRIALLPDAQMSAFLPLLDAAFALAWDAFEGLNWTWREVAGLRSDTYRLFEVLSHLASLQAASLAFFIPGEGQSAWAQAGARLDAWALDDWGRIGAGATLLADHTALLFEHLAPHADPQAASILRARAAALRGDPPPTNSAVRTLLQETAAFAARAALARHREALLVLSAQS